MFIKCNLLESSANRFKARMLLKQKKTTWARDHKGFIVLKNVLSACDRKLVHKLLFDEKKENTESDVWKSAIVSEWEVW